MSGEAFGLGVDLLAARPRKRCGDCGGSLVWDSAALDLFAEAPMAARDRAFFAEMWADGGSVYGCTSCGLVGAFSAPMAF